MYFRVIICMIFSSCCHIVSGIEHFPHRTAAEDGSFEVTIHPDSQKIVEGSPFVFTCISSNAPDVEFRWRKGYKTVDPRADGARVQRIANNISVLRIEEADMKKHKKAFACEASISSTGQKAKAEASVKIFRKGRTRKNFPALTEYPEDPIMLESGSELTLACKSNLKQGSREAPTWRWIKNGTVDLSLHHIGDTERMDMSEPGILEIDEARQSDSGTYECVAENRRGSAYSQPIVVEVIDTQKGSCIDRTGQRVAHGSVYQPSLDPCIECECFDGEERYCTTVMCDEPPCRNYDLIDGTCCGFRCHDEEVTEIGIWSMAGAGTCQQYLGTSCREFIQGRDIFMKPGYTQESLENKMRMLFIGAGNLSERCMEYILPFLCFHTIPLCQYGATMPRGRHVCREDCDMVTSICQDEYYVFRDQRINGTSILPQCEELPSRDFGEEECISFEEFIDNDVSREEDEEIAREGATCFDRFGNIVEDGDLYLPEDDPCLACTCRNGARVGCMTVKCERPSCNNFVRSSDSCCGYTCIEDVSNMTKGTCRSHEGAIVQDGEEYQPGGDPCVQCICQGGRKGVCRSIACMPPTDCPNPKPIPGLCCAFTCEEGSDRWPDVPLREKEPCVAYNGSYILNGDYQPGSDPCTRCHCVRGRKEACMTVACVPPLCPNAKPVPGVCCEFICPSSVGENLLNVFSSGEPAAPGSLSAQQVGSRSVIIQWKIESHRESTMLTLLYNSTRNSSLTNVTLPSDRSYQVLGDLDLSQEYMFMMFMETPEERHFLDSVHFMLDGRAGRTLSLGDVAHGEVYESLGRGLRFDRYSEVPYKENVYFVIDSFHWIETGKGSCKNTDGCGVLKFHMYGADGRLSPIVALMFEDERDFNWAKAHL